MQSWEKIYFSLVLNPKFMIQNYYEHRLIDIYSWSFFMIFEIAHKSSLIGEVGVLRGQFLVLANLNSHAWNHIFNTTKLTQINLKLLLIINTNYKISNLSKPPFKRGFERKFPVYLEYKSERQDACMSFYPKIWESCFNMKKKYLKSRNRVNLLKESMLYEHKYFKLK